MLNMFRNRLLSLIIIIMCIQTAQITIIVKEIGATLIIMGHIMQVLTMQVLLPPSIILKRIIGKDITLTIMQIEVVIITQEALGNPQEPIMVLTITTIKVKYNAEPIK
jgi:hypothetical protein